MKRIIKLLENILAEIFYWLHLVTGIEKFYEVAQKLWLN